MSTKNSNSTQKLLKNPKPTPNPDNNDGVVKSRTSKKKVFGVSKSISLSIRSGKKTDNSAKSKDAQAAFPPKLVEIQKSEKGVQVDEVEIIATDLVRIGEESGDTNIIRMPSAKVIKEIEDARKLKKQAELQARLNETRKFEKHELKQEIHITKLKEFLDTGAVKRQKERDAEPCVDFDPFGAPTSEKHNHALESYDRVKRKEDELVKLFNSF